MFAIILGWIGIAVLSANSTSNPASQESTNSAPSSDSSHRALLNRYCVTCHNERLLTAGLMLDKLDVEDVSKECRGVGKSGA